MTEKLSSGTFLVVVKGRKSLKNHIGAVHCLIAGSQCQGVLNSKIYILKIVIQCAGFISNTFILKFWCVKTKTKLETKLAKTVYSYDCKGNIHHLCSRRSSKRV